MRYTRWINYIFIFGFFCHCSCSAQKLTKEEFSALLPQRNKHKEGEAAENHFPSQPDLPNNFNNDIFFLVSNANDSYDAETIAKDVIGLPLGARESDFSKVTVYQDEQFDSDAVVIDAGGKKAK